MALDVVTDSFGNVYVAGRSSGAIVDGLVGAVVKYDSSGVEQWVSKYPMNSAAMDVDAADNIYVTGRLVSGQGFATVKYDTNGNELWAAIYITQTSFPYLPSIAVDNSGNAYITTISDDPGGWHDFTTIKYDANGNELWVAKYDGGGEDVPAAIALDGAGNVYITGHSDGNGYGNDFITVKYDANGNELWVARYGGGSLPLASDDNPVDIAVDAAGNAYVTGTSIDYFGGIDFAPPDIITVKYDANGNELWSTAYNGLANGRDYSVGVDLDGSGNVYVAGTSESLGSDNDILAIKYDANGNELWTFAYNISDHPGVADAARDIAVTPSGNVYITGWSQRPGWQAGDYTTIMLDATGRGIWEARYGGPNTDWPYAIATDAAGNAYVTGASYISGFSFDFLTIKYGPGGNQLWRASYKIQATALIPPPPLFQMQPAMPMSPVEASENSPDMTWLPSNTIPEAICCGWLDMTSLA
jgi:hypothetical protein